jgi:hypothetical protein
MTVIKYDYKNGILKIRNKMLDMGIERKTNNLINCMQTN